MRKSITPSFFVINNNLSNIPFILPRQIKKSATARTFNFFGILKRFYLLFSDLETASPPLVTTTIASRKMRSFSV